MTDQEIAWINAYHERVYKETAPLLKADEAEFLARKLADNLIIFARLYRGSGKAAFDMK